MSEITRADVERSVHRARSLVTVEPLPDDMAVIAGPRGRKERPRGIRKIRGMVKRQQIEIALGALPLDGCTWRNRARILHAMGQNAEMGNAASMVEAICAEFGIEEAAAC